MTGPWSAEIPTEVVSGKEFHVTFYCTYPDPSLCPIFYTVCFHGPTRQCILPDNFLPSTLATSPPYTQGIIEATWRIQDPGTYLVYAYPDFTYDFSKKKLHCRDWEEMEYPWHQAAVQNTPSELVVKPNKTQLRVEGYEPCSADEISSGRYVSTNANLSNQQFAQYYSNLNFARQFIWAPYSCKIPHRTAVEAISQLPSAKHILIFGDSTLRGFFCTRIFHEVHGSTKDTTCDIADYETYWDQSAGNTKSVWKVFQGEGGERNVSFSFVWCPHWRTSKPLG
jgi:hypothetical protein